MKPLYCYAAGSVVIFAIAATVTSLFYINFCGTVFRCGCQSLWTTAAMHCNIHAPVGKHCPWCSFGRAGYAAVYGPMLASQAVLSFVPRRWGWGARLAAALAAFPAVGGVLAILMGSMVGYWN